MSPLSVKIICYDFLFISHPAKIVNLHHYIGLHLSIVNPVDLDKALLNV